MRFDLFEDHFDEVVCFDAFGAGAEIEDEAVAEDGGGDAADVGEVDVGAAIEEGFGLTGEDEGLGGARAGAAFDVGRGVC